MTRIGEITRRRRGRATSTAPPSSDGRDVVGVAARDTTASASSAAASSSIAREPRAQDGVGGDRARHGRGRAAAHAAGQGQALLDRRARRPAPHGPAAAQHGGGGDGGGVARGVRAGCAGRRRTAHGRTPRRRAARGHAVALAGERDARGSRSPGPRFEAEPGAKAVRRVAPPTLLLVLPQLGQHGVVLERRRVAHRLLARGDVAQQAAHDLAAARLGQRVGEADLVGPGEGADLLARRAPSARARSASSALTPPCERDEGARAPGP